MKITIGMLLYLLSLDTAIYTNISRQADYVVDGFEIWDREFPRKNILYLITQEDLKKDPVLLYFPIVPYSARIFHPLFIRQSLSACGHSIPIPNSPLSKSRYWRIIKAVYIYHHSRRDLICQKKKKALSICTAATARERRPQAWDCAYAPPDTATKY